MPQATDPIADPERLAALRATGLLDTLPEEGFNQLARIAARLLEAPVALVSLVDEDRQFLKSCIGDIPEPFRSQRQTPLSHSFCKHVVASRELLAIEDAREHPLVRDNLATRDLGVVAYLGIPLITPEGQVLGTLCVIDSKPRRWSEAQIEHLQSLAAAVMSTITYRAAAQGAAPARGAASDEEGRASTPAEDGMGAFRDAAGTLADAVSHHLSRLDDYDRVIRAPEPSPQALAEEAEARKAVVCATAGLRGAAQEFRRRLEAAGRGPDDPEVRPAVELWQICTAYLEAEARRSEVGTRFQQLRAALDEVEREAMNRSLAEQALRMASLAYDRNPW
jgi:hypothetical protein